MARPLKNLCEVAVIGGGLAGLSAARHAARLGRLVTLFECSGMYGGQVATVEQADVQGSITRINESPAASINAEITSNDTGAVSKSVQSQIDALEASGQIPAGVTVQLAGVSQQQSEAFGGLFASMAVAILLVYLMMVLAFNSLITPFVILFTLPLATIGAFPALLLTGRPIGISALIGFLMLIGIVVTNAIVLLDLVERLRHEQGYTVHDALVEGGRTRVRPILMTAIATILALIPLAAGFNQGSIIAAELGMPLRVTSGPALQHAGDLAAVLSSLVPGEVLFLDEIHRMSRAAEEMLYLAMEDFRVDIIVGKGPGVGQRDVVGDVGEAQVEGEAVDLHDERDGAIEVYPGLVQIARIVRCLSLLGKSQ